VYCYGSNIGVADLNSPMTVARSIVATCHFPTAGAHTMKIVNEATAGRPWMDLDAFVAVS
jgi:hypothetical protein